MAMLVSSLCGYRSIHRLEFVFPRAAEGADPVVRNVLEGGAGRHAVVRVAVDRIVDVAADDASPFFHRGPPRRSVSQISWHSSVAASAPASLRSFAVLSQYVFTRASCWRGASSLSMLRLFARRCASDDRFRDYRSP